MTDWESSCHLCGRQLIHHVVYLEEPPDDAVEGEFDVNVRGFYCLTTSND